MPQYPNTPIPPFLALFPLHFDGKSYNIDGFGLMGLPTFALLFLTNRYSMLLFKWFCGLFGRVQTGWLVDRSLRDVDQQQLEALQAQVLKNAPENLHDSLQSLSPEELLAHTLQALEAQVNQSEEQSTAAPADEPLTKQAAESDWLTDLESCIRENINDLHFNVDRLAELLNTNRKTLYRQIRQLVGVSPNQYIQGVRLQRAQELLEAGEVHNMRDLANAVGMRTPDYLSRLYRKRFGKSPVDYW